MKLSRAIFPVLALFVLSLPSAGILKQGDEFQPFSLTNVDGTVYSAGLEDGRLVLSVETIKDGAKQSVKTHPAAILLDFWATWCVPCRAGMPYMQKLHEKYGPAQGQSEGGLRLFGVALDQKGSIVVKPFYEKLKINYPMLSDPTAGEGDGVIRTTRDMQTKYKVQEIPVVYIIDSRGVIQHAHIGFKKEQVPELEEAVARIAGEKNS